jgi:uncharacterized protein with NRDE domain
MCTLIALHRCVPGKPLVIAANRDEFLARPAEGPALRMRGSGPILAPLDLEAGGTWLGLNARGVFVGLTNLRPDEQITEHLPQVQEDTAQLRRMATPDPTPEDLTASRPVGKPGARSRGEVVMAALDASSASEAAARIADLEASAYNPFQLLMADDREAWLTVYRDEPQVLALEPGVHVVGNVEDERIGAALGAAALESPNARARAVSEQPRARKLARIRERVEKLLTGGSRDLLEDLGDVCREHVESDPFESTCVHVAERYGTRSSLLLELAEERNASRLWATDGPPCDRSFENLSALLEQLDARSRRFTQG